VISISTDGVEWFEVGRAAGGTAAVDIARLGKQNEQYRYVRLTDARADCGGEWPGADIDAVGAIGSAFRVSFDEKVLFDVGKSELRQAARGALIEAAGKLAAIKDTRIQIEGHTDNTGGAEMNQRLSEERAESVRAFLSDQPALAGRTIIAKGFGMSRPTSTNATAPGRQKNRRVDIIAAPTR